MIVTQVPGIDLERTGAAPITDIERSLESDAPIVLIDSGSLTNGTLRQHPIWAELDQGSESPETDSLTIRPGVNLANGERYVVALRDLRDASGDLLEPGRAFEVYRDRIPTFRSEIEERRPQMEEIFDILERAGIEREGLYLAWDFTVISKRNMSERMLEMRDDAFASLAGAAPAFAVSEVLAQPEAQLYRQVEGSYRVPLYLNDDGVPGSRLTRSEPEDPDSLPVRVGDFTARFLCIIPNAVLSEQKGGGLVADPGRPSLYGHGLLGSRSETRSGHNRDFADEYGFVSCGTDWIGMAAEDVPNIVANILRDFSHFPEIPDRLQQAYLNFLFLGRLLLHEDGFASHCAFQAVEWAPEGEEQCPVSGEPVFDRREVFYDGNSQGALAGGALAAFAQDWTRFVLGVAGMNYSTLLRRSVDFDAFDILLSASYPNRLDAQISIALAQMLWDRADTSGHASHLTSDTYPDTPRKKILLHVAFGDHQVANVSAEIEARTMGAHIHQPALATGRHSDVDPYWGIPAIDADPFAGSAMVIWDSGTATPPTDNVPPREGQDPHETPRRDPKAKLQKSEFLKTGGAIIDVCEGVPCTAVDP